MTRDLLFQPSIRNAIQTLAGRFADDGRTVTVIQVGACNGNIRNDPVQEIIKGNDYISAHLVEAVSWLYEDLVQIMAPHSDYIQCYNLAIGARDEVRKFFYVSERYQEDHPDAAEWKKYQIGSLTDQHLKRWIPDEYIEAVEVQCMSPGTLLKIANVRPRDLNLLVVDAEGFDGQIVTGFLEITRPEMIVYEHKIMSAEENEKLCALMGGFTYGFRKIGEDMLAVRVP